MSIWGTFDDHRILTTLITSWGLWCRLEYLLWTYEDFEGFDNLLRNLRTFLESVENLRSEDLGYLLCIFLTFWGLCWTFWGILEDLTTWCSQNVEEPFRNFWWLLVEHLRTVFRNIWGLCEDHLMTIWGTFDDHRILTTLITLLGTLMIDWNTFCGPLRTSRALMTFWGIWGHFEDQLRTWGLRTLGTFCAFSWLFEDFAGPFEEFWKTWGPDFLRTLKNLSGTFDDFLWTYWGPDAFEDYNDFSGHWGFCEPDYLLRTLRTLINFWGLWNRLEYVLWTYEDFEGFDNLLRNLRPFWGSVENLRSEDLGYLLCIFLTFWGLCGPFEDFLKTWGPDALRTLKNLSGTFDDFLWTI